MAKTTGRRRGQCAARGEMGPSIWGHDGGTASCRAPRIQCGERCASQGQRPGTPRLFRLFAGDNGRASGASQRFWPINGSIQHPGKKSSVGVEIGKSPPAVGGGPARAAGLVCGWPHQPRPTDKPQGFLFDLEIPSTDPSPAAPFFISRV